MVKLWIGYKSLNVSVITRKGQTGAQVVIKFKPLTSKQRRIKQDVNNKSEDLSNGLKFSLFGLFQFRSGISTLLGYFMPNLFLYKQSVLFQTINFRIIT